MKISEKLKALQAQRQTAIDAADAILATVSDESLSPEQTAECDKHLAEVDRIGGEIELAVKSEKDVADKIAKLESLRNAPMNVDIARVVEYEQKVSKMLCEQKQVESLEKSGRISKLSVDIMKKKVCEKVSQELTTEQFKMVKMSLVGDKTNLVPLLEKTKSDAFETIGEFSHKNNNGILKEKLNEVKMQIENLSSSDITEENVSKFLLLNKMIEEMTGADDGGR